MNFSTQGFQLISYTDSDWARDLLNEIALWAIFSSWVIRHFLGHQRSKILSLFLLVKRNMLLDYLEFVIQFGNGIYLMIFNLIKNSQRRFTLTTNQLLHLQRIRFFMKGANTLTLFIILSRRP